MLYSAGVLGASLVTVGWYSPLAIGLCTAAVTLGWLRARAVLLCVLVFATGWANYALQTASISPNDLRKILHQNPGLVTVRGTLRETPSLRVYERDEVETWRALARLEVVAIRVEGGDWHPATGTMVVSSGGTLTNFFAGQILEITGVARAPKVAAAAGLFDYRDYLKQKKIYFELQTTSESDWQILKSPANRPISDRFQEWARKALGAGLPREDESLRLEWALTLGWKTALTEAVTEPFVRAATYHIFAVDGLRMAIIFGIFFALLRACGLQRGICGLVLLPLIWFYTALTGWPASAIRATVMLSVIIVGWALKRPSDLLNSLFAAALIILVWQPQQVFQAGFQLSFCVVLCMILIIPPLHAIAERLTAPDPLLPAELLPRWRRILAVPSRYIGELVLASLAAWLGSIPLVAYYFNLVTPVSTPANIIAVPLCALILSSNLASLIVAAWFPVASELFNHAGWFLMECIRVSSEWFADWPRAYYYVSAPTLFTIFYYYAVLLLVVTGWVFKPDFRKWKVAAVALLTCCWCWQAYEDTLFTRLNVLSLTGGNAIYAHGHGIKKGLLIDCGTTNEVNLVTKPFLRAQGVNRLPGLMLTHGDLHQMGGAKLVRELFSVDTVYASPLRFRSAAYRNTLKEFEGVPGLLNTVGRNEQVGAWTILHPDAEDQFGRADDGALVLSGSFHGTRILLLSDLGRSGQDTLVARYPSLKADIVVTGIPAGSEPLCDPLLDAIQPRVIIVTDSEYPVNARAAPRVRRRLGKSKVPVIYTRYSGSVTIEVREGGFELRSMDGTKITSSKGRTELVMERQAEIDKVGTPK
jgi:ComEC/Rec2-related protein